MRPLGLDSAVLYWLDSGTGVVDVHSGQKIAKRQYDWEFDTQTIRNFDVEKVDFVKGKLTSTIKLCGSRLGEFDQGCAVDMEVLQPQFLKLGTHRRRLVEDEGAQKCGSSARQRNRDEIWRIVD